MNEKTIDQIEEVLMCEISDEAVEAAGKVEIAGGVDVCLHQHSVRSPVCTYQASADVSIILLARWQTRDSNPS